jgi:hypothetical protein
MTAMTASKSKLKNLAHLPKLNNTPDNSTLATPSLQAFLHSGRRGGANAITARKFMRRAPFPDALYLMLRTISHVPNRRQPASPPARPPASKARLTASIPARPGTALIRNVTL